MRFGTSSYHFRLLYQTFISAAIAAPMVLSAIPIAADTAWQSNGVPVCAVADAQESPYPVGVGAGETIVVWADRRGTDYDIYAQRLNPEGHEMWATGGVKVCGAEYDQQFPMVVGDGSGGAIVAWQDGRQGDDGLEIYAQRIGAGGTTAWQADGVPVCTYQSGLTDPPAAFSHVMTSDEGGGAIIAWRDTRADPVNGNTEVYTQRIDGSGTPQWTLNGVKLLGFGTLKWATRNPIVASDGAGGAVVVWQDGRNSQSTANDLYAQRVTSAGAVSWAANGVVVCNAAGDQGYPDIVDAENGDVVVAWEDKRGANYDIYAQKLNSSGAPQWGANGRLVCSSANDQRTPRVVSDGGDCAIVAWTDKRGNTLYTDIYAQKLDALGAPLWANQGIAVCLATGSQTRVRMCPSYAGSVILTWMDTRNEPAVAFYDLYAQMMDSAGLAKWAADGVPMAALTGTNQRTQQAVSDGVFGVCATWEDDRNAGDWDIYAQRLSPWSVVSDIAGAKSRPTGTPVSLPARVVTGTFGGYFYVEESQRYSGIKVLSDQSVSTGDLVAVAGTVEQGYERYINAYSVTAEGTGPVPGPLAHVAVWLGGTGAGSAQGLSDLGLLMRIWGRVTDKVTAPEQYLIVNDGSAEVRVCGPATADTGDYVIVTGISSCQLGISGLLPSILTRESSDTRILIAH